MLDWWKRLTSSKEEEKPFPVKDIYMVESVSINSNKDLITFPSFLGMLGVLKGNNIIITTDLKECYVMFEQYLYYYRGDEIKEGLEELGITLNKRPRRIKKVPSYIQ